MPGCIPCVQTEATTPVHHQPGKDSHKGKGRLPDMGLIKDVMLLLPGGLKADPFPVWFLVPVRCLAGGSPIHVLQEAVYSHRRVVSWGLILILQHGWCKNPDLLQAVDIIPGAGGWYATGEEDYRDA